MGESVVVFGAGGVGLNIIQACALHTAYPIIAVDLFDNRLNRSFFGLCLNLIVLFLIIDAFNTDLIFTKIFWIFFSIMNYTKIEFSQKKI